MTRSISLTILLILSLSAQSQYFITDTIYYNTEWKICEKENAWFMRAGVLAANDSFWYYTGKVKDMSLKGELIMEGQYSADGLKHGNFTFYYSGGKIHCSGSYHKDLPAGTWQWYYPDGRPHATIFFPGSEDDFQIIKYFDASGKVTLDNGTGIFEWMTSPFNVQYGVFHVGGSFENGKRSGVWNFSQYNDQYHSPLFREKYDKEGKHAKTVFVNYRGAKADKPFHFNFSPNRLRVIEAMAYDNFFHINGDSLAALSVYNYLVTKKSTTIIAKNENFDSAFSYMLRTLYSYRSNFDYWGKDINATIEFRIGEKKIPEDISINGNLTQKERDYLEFLMNKFENIDMPSHDNIGYEGYHTIHFYSLDLQRFFPSEFKYPEKLLFITTVKREQMVGLLEASKKQLKKFIRRNYLWY